MRKIYDIMESKYVVFALFLAAAFFVYLSSISSPFHFDDLHNIVENHDVAVKDLSIASLKRAALTRASGLRPVSYLTFAVNYFVSGRHTASYHAVNILIHIVNALLIYLIILRLFGYGAADDKEQERLKLSALFTALIWLVTPLNSQAVISIVQRMTLLMTLFFLAAFLCYILAGEKGKASYYLLSALFFILSVMSKQNGAVFPLAIIVYELALVKKGDIKGITKKELIALAVPLVILAATLIMYRGAIIEGISEGYSVRPFTMSERVLTQLRVLVFYLTLIVLPLPGRLSITHDIVKSTSMTSPVTTLLSFILLLALFVIAIVRMKRSPYLSFALLWFFATMSVESTIIPLEMAYEHRMYLPGIFLFGYVIDFVISKAREGESRFYVTAGLFCVVLTFSIFTSIRGQVWQSSISIWSDVLEKYPDDPRGQFNLGNAYSELKKFEEAEIHYISAIDKWSESTVNKKNLSFAYSNLGGVLLELKRLDEAEKNFLNAIRQKDDYAPPHNNLGRVYRLRGDSERALSKFNDAIEIAPEYILAYLNAADAYQVLKEYDKALEYYNKVIALDSNNSSAYNDIGTVYADLKDYDKALYYFEKAYRMNPGNTRAKNNIKIAERLIKNRYQP